MALRETANISRTGHFKAIKVAKNKHWSSLLLSATPQNMWTARGFASGRAPPRFPSLPGAETQQQINDALLGHFFPSKAAFSPPPRLRPHNSTPLLTKEEIAHALSKSASSSAPGPDQIPYLTGKQVNAINPLILLLILSPLVSLWYHPALLKVANGVVLDKPGKPWYESPSSFRMIVLLQTVSKIRERIIAARLILVARSRGQIQLNQCGSLPGLSTYNACLTLMNDVKALQRPRLKVFPLLLDIQSGFDNVDKPTLARILREGGIPHYLVSWVASILGERSCTLDFPGAPGTPAPVNIGAPQSSPVSPLLFLIDVAPLYFRIPRGLMLSYVDDFALTATSLSCGGNIRRLQELFRTIQAKAVCLDISFSVLTTELIHWRTPSQRHSQLCLSPIQLDGEILHPRLSLRWLGY